MKNFTYSGTNATTTLPVGCEHDWERVKRGSIIGGELVKRVEVFKCPQCGALKTDLITQYPPAVAPIK